MRLQTTIKISKEFKEDLSQKKQDGETFEQIIKRLIRAGIPKGYTSIPSSIPYEGKGEQIDKNQALEMIRKGIPIIINNGKYYEKKEHDDL